MPGRKRKIHRGVKFQDPNCKKIYGKNNFLKKLTAGLIALIAVIILFTSVDASAEQIKTKGVLTIGVRADAPPFSYCRGNKPEQCMPKEDSFENYDGFSIEICEQIAKKAIEMGIFDEIKVIKVTAQNRFQFLQNREIDILCGATTVTLERMRVADFSLFTFASGMSVMYKQTPIFKQEGEKAVIKIGYLKNTTSEAADLGIIKKVKSELGYDDNVIIDSDHPQCDHYSGVEDLLKGSIDAYLADREILLALKKDHPNLVVSRKYFTIEPYAIGLKMMEPELRFVANSVICELFGNPMSDTSNMPIIHLLRKHFPGSGFNNSLINLYRSQRLRTGSPIATPDLSLPCQPNE